MTTALMEAAEIIPSYAAAGLAVLPLHSARGGLCTCCRPDCASPAKHPLTRNGKDDATCNLVTIAEWFAQWPWCNWGVRPLKGTIVIDVDPRHGGDVNLLQLTQKHGNLPNTLTARTGSGGLHIWLTYIGPSRGKLCTGVDIKTNSGYLVAPPSLHASGGIYTWGNNLPAAYAPRWIKLLLNPPARRYATPPGDKPIEPLVRFVAESVEGERNSRLYWAACRAHENGLDPEPLIDAAESVGLPTMAAHATVRSAATAAPRNGRPAA
jgi:hypothetical protein